MIQIFIIGLVALSVGALIGWLLGGRAAWALKAERDVYLENFKSAIRDLEGAVNERDSARLALARLEAEQAAFNKEAMAAQFAEISHKLLGEAQQQFIERADQRFKQSEETSGAALKSLLQPVNERLLRYEESVAKVEKDRSEAYGNLQGLMESMRVGQESVRAEAAKLGNSLRNGPKARGRWGEQQLRNVLETCGLSEHADFQTEVSVETGDGRLRPDVIIRVPGGRNLVIDAKVSLNAYQDAFEAGEDGARKKALEAHAAAMKAHVNTLGQKAYQDQFEDTPDYVIMFVPGEHFLTAALEQEPDMWDFALAKRVIMATPTNLIAIARTVSAVWQQEKVVGQAREIAELGKELYARLLPMTGHISKLGNNLNTAVSAYNSFVGSLEDRVLKQAQRFESLGIDTTGKTIEPLPVVELTARPLVKLVPISASGEPALKIASNDANIDVEGAG